MARPQLGPGDRSFRLHRIRKIPKGWQPRLDLAWRLVREITASFHHFSGNPRHCRDSPARRRFETNRIRLAETLDLLCEEDPMRGALERHRIEILLLQEIGHGRETEN